jgi:hypothetical protein
MDLYDAKIVQDVRLFGAVGVSAKCGRKVLDVLESQGVVSPLRTPTGRTVLSFREAEAVMKSFAQSTA